MMIEIEYSLGAEDPKTVEKEVLELNRLLEFVNAQLKKPYYAKYAWLSDNTIDVKKKRILFDKTVFSINIFRNSIKIHVRSMSQAKKLKSLAEVIEQKFGRTTSITIYSNYAEISELKKSLKKEVEMKNGKRK